MPSRIEYGFASQSFPHREQCSFIFVCPLIYSPCTSIESSTTFKSSMNRSVVFNPVFPLLFIAPFFAEHDGHPFPWSKLYANGFHIFPQVLHLTWTRSTALVYVPRISILEFISFISRINFSGERVIKITYFIKSVFVKIKSSQKSVLTRRAHASTCSVIGNISTGSTRFKVHIGHAINFAHVKLFF